MSGEPEKEDNNESSLDEDFDINSYIEVYNLFCNGIDDEFENKHSSSVPPVNTKEDDSANCKSIVKRKLFNDPSSMFSKIGEVGLCCDTSGVVKSDSEEVKVLAPAAIPSSILDERGGLCSASASPPIPSLDSSKDSIENRASKLNESKVCISPSQSSVISLNPASPLSARTAYPSHDPTKNISADITSNTKESQVCTLPSPSSAICSLAQQSKSNERQEPAAVTSSSILNECKGSNSPSSSTSQALSAERDCDGKSQASFHPPNNCTGISDVIMNSDSAAGNGTPLLEISPEKFFPRKRKVSHPPVSSDEDDNIPLAQLNTNCKNTSSGSNNSGTKKKKIQEAELISKPCNFKQRSKVPVLLKKPILVSKKKVKIVQPTPKLNEPAQRSKSTPKLNEPAQRSKSNPKLNEPTQRSMSKVPVPVLDKKLTPALKRKSVSGTEKKIVGDRECNPKPPNSTQSKRLKVPELVEKLTPAYKKTVNSVKSTPKPLVSDKKVKIKVPPEKSVPEPDCSSILEKSAAAAKKLKVVNSNKENEGDPSPNVAHFMQGMISNVKSTPKPLVSDKRVKNKVPPEKSLPLTDRSSILEKSGAAKKPNVVNSNMKKEENSTPNVAHSTQLFVGALKEKQPGALSPLLLQRPNHQGTPQEVTKKAVSLIRKNLEPAIQVHPLQSPPIEKNQASPLTGCEPTAGSQTSGSQSVTASLLTSANPELQSSSKIGHHPVCNNVKEVPLPSSKFTITSKRREANTRPGSPAPIIPPSIRDQQSVPVSASVSMSCANASLAENTAISTLSEAAGEFNEDSFVEDSRQEVINVPLPSPSESCVITFNPRRRVKQKVMDSSSLILRTQQSGSETGVLDAVSPLPSSHRNHSNCDVTPSNDCQASGSGVTTSKRSLRSSQRTLPRPTYRELDEEADSDIDSNSDDDDFNITRYSEEEGCETDGAQSSSDEETPLIVYAAKHNTGKKCANKKKSVPDTPLQYDSEEDADSLLDSTPGRKPAKKNGRNGARAPVDHNWKEGDLEMQERPCPDFPPADFVQNPIEYFRYFFDDEIMQYFADQTNLYSTFRDGKCLDVTKKEIEIFLGIWIYMGICSLPSYLDYWNGHTRVAQIADLMSLKRYEKIKSRFHLVDCNAPAPEGDRYHKVRPLLQHMKTKCNGLEQQENEFSIDESLVLYKGKKAGHLRQYLPNKPNKWGFKFFMLCGVSGITYDFLAYQGSDTFHGIDLSEEVRLMGVGGQVVTTLCKTISLPRLSTVCFDNWFTSISLLKHLKTDMGLLSTGTIRRTRVEGCPLLDAQTLSQRGKYDVKVSDDGIACVTWLDKKLVTLVSTQVGAAPAVIVKRYDKKKHGMIEVTCPSIVRKYNSTMGGVDTFDMLTEIYRMPTRAKRWYIPVVGFMLSLALVNSWLMYKRDSKKLEEPMAARNSKEFRLHIFSSLVSAVRRRGRPSAAEVPTDSRIKSPVVPRPFPADRKDDTDHWPIFADKRGRCRFCVGGFTDVMCAKCGMQLCFRKSKNCFVAFHREP